MQRDDIHLGNWRKAPFSGWAFSHVREVLPTAEIRGASQVAPLPRQPIDLTAVTVARPEGGTGSLGAVLAETHTDGFMVLQRGAVVFEWSGDGDIAGHPHIMFSVSKSITGALAGCLAAEGLLDPEAPVRDYLPEVATVAGSTYADATVRHVLDMQVSVAFDEDYLDPMGVFARYRRAHGWNPFTADDEDQQDFLLSLKPESGVSHGERMHYASPNSDLLGWILERAAKRRFAELLSERIWQPLGASEAYVTVDRLGAARSAGGICTRIEDAARFGEMMRNRGMAQGRQIVPGSWIDDIRQGGSREAWLAGDLVRLLPEGQYRSQWYQTGTGTGAFCAIGIHGQWIHIDPQAALVIVKQSSQPEPVDDPMDQLVLAAFDAVIRHLS